MSLDPIIGWARQPSPFYRCSCGWRGERSALLLHPRQGYGVCPRCWRNGYERSPDRELGATWCALISERDLPAEGYTYLTACGKTWIAGPRPLSIHLLDPGKDRCSACRDRVAELDAEAHALEPTLATGHVDDVRFRRAPRVERDGSEEDD